MRARKLFWLWVWMMYTLVGMGIVSACIPGMEQAEPIIVLDPITGGPGTSVTVTGSGFPAETQVSVRLGPPSVGATPQSYGDATTDVDGRFTLSFTMPAHWPDGAPITEADLVVVVINEDGNVKATAPFSFEPEVGGQPMLSLKPGNAGPGQQIEVVGYYFRAGAQIALRLGVPNAGLGDDNLMEVQADEHGTFEVALTLPATWPGSGAPITEQDLVIVAVDEGRDQALATASFFNTKSRAYSVTPADQPEADLVQVYSNDEGDFSLLLPPDWEVAGPTITELGSQYLMGPAAVSDRQGPGNSSLLITDAVVLPAEKAAELLCGGCTPVPTLQECKALPVGMEMITSSMAKRCGLLCPMLQIGFWSLPRQISRKVPAGSRRLF